MPDLVARVLAGRGIDVDGVAGFLAPTLRDVDARPLALTDMDGGATGIADAVDDRRDGSRSSAITMSTAPRRRRCSRAILRHTGSPTIHIPDRLFEGYGPNIDAVRASPAQGVRLLVAVDCGSTSHRGAGGGARLGLESS